MLFSALYIALRVCCFVNTVQLSSHLKAVLLSQDAGVDRFDDGVLVQSEVQRLGSAAGRQQGLMGVGLFEALHQTGPGRSDSCG